MTHSSHRRRLVPKSAIVASVVIVLLIAAAAAASLCVARSRLVAVPDVIGLPAAAAEASIEAEGLTYEVAGTRVSVSVPSGDVIEQDPAADELAEPGATVGVVLSVGPQTFAVPDLVGSSVDGARDALTALGLSVVIEAVSSETTAPVVLEMFPAPGAPVSPGDEIRLSVPGGSGSTDVLLPYDLSGITVLLDPQPAPGDLATDVSMEVGRRLQSLLEAAGARVATTRTGVDGVTPESREAVAAASSADVIIGIGVGSDGVAGLKVLYLPEDAGAERSALSLEYARAITRAATLPSLVVNEPDASRDAVLMAFPETGVLVLVGDAMMADDLARFADPAWADQVARSIYRGVGAKLDGT